MTFTFKQDFTFEQRKEESKKVMEKYPDRRPIICEKIQNHSGFLPDIDRKKYLVPVDLTIGQFMYVIRKRLKLASEEAMFLFINGKLISGSAVIGLVYQFEHDPDGFLYVQYAKENTFG